MKISRCYGCCLLMAVAVAPVAAQERLEEIVVTATRTEQRLSDVPFAVSLISNREIHLGRQELGLDEALARVPGLFMQNRYNFAQDLRVSIRGFGSRANFGIRGIKVFADGIPVTLADGQSGTDDLDIGSARRIEVIRGPSAALYGTAAGGVISLTTEDGPKRPVVEPHFTIGAYGQKKYQLKAGGQSRDFNYLVNASHLDMHGYRDYSEVEHSLINSKFRYTLNDGSSITLIANAVDSPLANDPGGITRDEVAEDRRQAQERNLSSNAGEAFDQQRLGLVYDKTFNQAHRLTLRNYYLWKEFQTFIPIGTHIPFVGDDGVVEFDRFFYGGGAKYTYSSSVLGRPHRLTMGFDVDIQRDDRQRFLNNAGVKGEEVFDQMERADSYGVYFRSEIDITPEWIFSVGGRYDALDLSVEDRYLDNGEQSGDLDFSEYSPSLGLTWKRSDLLNVYANFATAFETPTFTELGTPAQELNVNLGGFGNVREQQAESLEMGVRGGIEDALFYEVAAYTMTVVDEITNIESIANRAFFENADTDRRGLEASIQLSPTENLGLTASYTLSDFTFDRFPSEPEAVGGWIPGIPRHQFFAELDYSHDDSGVFVIWDILMVGRFYADNANTEEVDSYMVSNLRMGKGFEIGDLDMSYFVGINNLFDEKYFSNVRINSFGGRAFEPAPERHLYGGFQVSYSF